MISVIISAAVCLPVADSEPCETLGHEQPVSDNPNVLSKPKLSACEKGSSTRRAPVKDSSSLMCASKAAISSLVTGTGCKMMGFVLRPDMGTGDDSEEGGNVDAEDEVVVEGTALDETVLDDRSVFGMVNVS